jgi:hypothetical protein
MGAHKHNNRNNSDRARREVLKRDSKKFGKKADHVKKGLDTGRKR